MRYNIELIKWIDIVSYSMEDPLKNEPSPVYFLSVGVVLGKCKLKDGNVLLRVVNPVTENTDDFKHCDYFDIPIQNIISRQVLGSLTLNDGVICFNPKGKRKCARVKSV